MKIIFSFPYGPEWQPLDEALRRSYASLEIVFSARTMGRGLALAAHKAGASECVLSSNLAQHLQKCAA